MKFIIIHGSFGGPEKHWFPKLKEQLESLQQEVIAPQFPVDDWETVTKNGPSIRTKNQNLDNWLKTFASFVLPTINKNERICFVGHSLGPLFTLHAVERFEIQLDCAIFVSPFLGKLGCDWQIDHANETFWKTDFDFEKLIASIPVSYTIYSDNDPYVAEAHSVTFGEKMNSSLIPVCDLGHMNSEVPLLSFPLIYDLCKTRLDRTVWIS